MTVRVPELPSIPSDVNEDYEFQLCNICEQLDEEFRCIFEED